MLVLVGLGLLGFVTLRFMQAFIDTDRKGNGMKAIFRRLGFAFSGFIYLGISIYAIKTALGSQSGGDTKKELISKVFEYPGGVLLVGLVAGIVIGQGLYQIYRGVSRNFMKKVQLHHSDFKSTFKKIGIVGHFARGIVLCLIGYLLLRAALDSNPDQAEGTNEAFNFLKQKGGSWVPGLVALGFFAYGIFMFVRAKHEKINL